MTIDDIINNLKLMHQEEVYVLNEKCRLQGEYIEFLKDMVNKLIEFGHEKIEIE